MWNRAELKSRGKLAFKANYWKCVLVAFLASLATGSASSSGSTSQQLSETNNYNYHSNPLESIAIAGIVVIVFVVAFALVLAIRVFVLNPLLVGCDNFFLVNRQDPSTDLHPLSHGFKANYKNVAKAMFFRDLYIFLWSLLFIIPGIIKSYEYRLVPYLLAENPDMEYHEALDLSKSLMDGSKMDAFVLDLSFIGWIILGILTFGLLLIFYVNPYIQGTNAELFCALSHPGETIDFDYVPSEASQTVEFEVK